MGIEEMVRGMNIDLLGLKEVSREVVYDCYVDYKER